MQRLNYLYWALTHLNSSTSCPACGSPSRLVRRKYFVTSLRECNLCALRFRVPKDDQVAAQKFYVDEVYKQGFTTDLPTDTELQSMLRNHFAGTEKEFSPRIEVLRAAGLKTGARILDFGSSWGYGSWQMKQAGFEVLSYEIGQARARYAKEKLDCNTVTDLRSLDGTIDCFFSSHVIEHLPNPNILFEEATRVLHSEGILVCYCPNGAPEREQEHGEELYDRNWGMVHPLMITPTFMKRKSTASQFNQVKVFTSPINPAEVSLRRDGKLDGEELLTIAYRAHELPS